MSGLVNKRNVFQVYKTFGLWTALKMLLSKEKTFLEFLTKHTKFFH